MPKSLLLADDSVTIQKAVEMTFKAEDVTLTVVSDGNQALSHAREAKPDLILADVSMPGLGGYELCEKVRADASMRHTPVLLLGPIGVAAVHERTHRLQHAPAQCETEGPTEVVRLFRWSRSGRRFRGARGTARLARAGR